MPRRVMPAPKPPPNLLDHRTWAESEFQAAFLKLVSRVGAEEAWRIYEKLGKAPRGRPRGPTNPERNEELRRLVTALNTPNPMQTAEAARLIDAAFPKAYGSSAKAIEMTIHRFNRKNI